MSGSAVAFLDLPANYNQHPVNRNSDVAFSTGISFDKIFPGDPSLLRLANSRFLMDRVSTTEMPDWETLKNITFDHDIFTALQMISFDTVTGYTIGGEDISPVYIRSLEDLDEDIDLSEIYREVAYDELRYGNAIVKKNHKSLAGRRLFVSMDVINPERIVDMQMSKYNKPMWWVFKNTNPEETSFLYEDITDEYIAFVDPEYMKDFKTSGYSGSKIVGPTTDIVHFKGSAPSYQKWGVGIAQVAKILIEAKLDMLVDFSKIIKKEAGTREIVYVDVKGLNPEAERQKINNTVTNLTEQRKRGAVIVLGKNGQDDALDVKYVGSEGKVLDNFSLHYRDDILRAIRILTRLPPSFWLGEATNKATINTQLVIYNRFLNSLRWFESKRFRREIFKPYINQQFGVVSLKEVPKITFKEVDIQDPMDRAVIDQIYVGMGAKSRAQVAKENEFQLPEEAGETPPSQSQSQASQMLLKNHLGEAIGVGANADNL